MTLNLIAIPSYKFVTRKLQCSWRNEGSRREFIASQLPPTAPLSISHSQKKAFHAKGWHPFIEPAIFDAEFTTIVDPMIPPGLRCPADELHLVRRVVCVVPFIRWLRVACSRWAKVS
jgi:hypothetical protein